MAVFYKLEVMSAQVARKGRSLGWMYMFEFGQLQILKLSAIKCHAAGGLCGNAFRPQGELDREPHLKNERLFFMFSWTLSPLFMEFSHICFRNKTCCPPQPASCFVLQCGKANSGVGRALFGAFESCEMFASLVCIQPSEGDGSECAPNLCVAGR